MPRGTSCPATGPSERRSRPTSSSRATPAGSEVPTGGGSGGRAIGSDQVMPLPAGRRIGPYEILGPLGAGGMGEVYRGRDSRLEREVAIKVLPSALAEIPHRVSRFEREARAASALNHPN